VTTTPTLDRYRIGDLAKLPMNEPDPVPNWAGYTEKHAHDLRSIRIGDQLVACFGYFPLGNNEADAFAVIDRDLCAGHGKPLAALVRSTMLDWMDHISVTTTYAECAAQDRTAQVFLRAVGFRRVGYSPQNNHLFKFTRR